MSLNKYRYYVVFPLVLDIAHASIYTTGMKFKPKKWKCHSNRLNTYQYNLSFINQKDIKLKVG